MKNIVKILSVFILVLILLDIDDPSVRAQSIDKQQEVLNIPMRICDYANENVINFYEDVFEVKIRKDTISLCNPYVIYYSIGEQDAVYYFPVMKNGKIVDVMSVAETSQGLIAQFEKENAEILEKNNYQKENYIFYEYEGSIYMENQRKK